MAITTIELLLLFGHRPSTRRRHHYDRRPPGTCTVGGTGVAGSASAASAIAAAFWQIARTLVTQKP
ncbi:MAG TPA: hypothetical protein VHI74_01770 [Methyloceanibacter sp.]|nr:hypothetical protein [Methyloceanibacter sp.]